MYLRAERLAWIRTGELVLTAASMTACSDSRLVMLKAGMP